MENVRLSFPDSGDVTVSVRHFHVEEAMSGLFAARIVAVSSMESIDLSRLVGSRAVVELEGTMQRRWRGLCEAAEFVRVSETAEGLATYEFVVVPKLWKLTQRLQNRLFQHITIPDIVDALLAEWEIERQWNIDREQYPQLELRTQYGESDFAFLSRLLEEAGIAYYFDDDGQEDARLHLGDEPERREGRAGPPLPFTDDPSQAFAAGDQFVTKVRLRERSRPGRVMLRDYDFLRPRVPLYARADAQRTEEQAHEQYAYAPGVALSEASAARSVLTLGSTPVADELGSSRSREPHAGRMAQRMLESLQAERRILMFETSVNDLSPGTVFRIADHPRADISADKRLLSIRHVLEGKVADPNTWTFSVVAVDCDKPWRPSRVTPKPRILGLQTAVVVGPGEEGGPAPMRLPNAVGTLNPTPLDANSTIGSLQDNEIYVDEHGRVRAQFPWDREHGFNKLSSIWMRVSQGWAGSGYGMFTIPRVGHEVLVAFLDGDPDCPLIVGRVHNGAQPTPFPLPQNKTVSTFKTASSPGGGGFNELRFDDAAGGEHVYLQAQRNMDQLVKNDLKQAVGGDTSRYAQGDDSTAVGGRRTKFVNLDEVETTGVNRSVSVGANRVTNIGSEDSTFVGSRWSVTIARGLARKLIHEVDNAAKHLGESVRSVADTVLGQIPSNPQANPLSSALADFGRNAFGSFRNLLALATDFEMDSGPPPTTIEVVDRQIKLSTGEASIVLDGPNVTISAQGVVAIHAMDHISILAEKEVAIAARGKAAIVSATDDVLVQASKDVHLNPFSGGKLQDVKAVRSEG
jgi:type VI secretion system secreted protein VgrG